MDTGPRGRRISLQLGVILLAVGAVLLLTRCGGEAGASEVTLQSIGEVGADAYTDSVAPPPSASLADFAETGAPPGAEVPETEAAGVGVYQTTDGDVPGAFAGTAGEGTCNTDLLVTFLLGEPDRSEVWAETAGIGAEDIPDYVAALTAANLGYDTRIADNGFSDGESVSREAVLQRGTAVLLDPSGVPRVNCYSGNPLGDPNAEDDEEYQGEQWTSFEPATVVLVAPGSVASNEFVLLDVETAQLFSRPVGSAGESDVAPTTEPEPTPEPTPAPTAEPEVTATVDVPVEERLELNTVVTGEHTTSEPTRYTFDVEDGAVLDLEIANDRASAANLGVELLSAGQRHYFFRVSPGGTEQRTYVLDHQSGGPFELLISEGPAAYEFTMHSEVQDDAGLGQDAGDDLNTGLEFESGDQVEGLVADLDTADAFLIDVPGGVELRFTSAVSTTFDSNGAFDLRLNGQRLHFGRTAPGQEDEFSVLLGADEVGVLEVLVDEAPVEYSFTVDLIEQEDGGLPGDAPEELADGRFLESVEAFSGEVGELDSGDLYLFDSPAAELSVTVGADVTNTGNIAVDIRGPDGNRITFFRVSPGTESTEVFEALPGEQYQLLVTEHRGLYTISILDSALAG